MHYGDGPQSAVFYSVINFLHIQYISLKYNK